MSDTVVQGPWLKPAEPRAHFGQRKIFALQDVREAVDVATGRDRVKEAAAVARAELQRAGAAKVECLAALAGQLASEMHATRNGRAATKLMAIQEMLETLAAECEP